MSWAGSIFKSGVVRGGRAAHEYCECFVQVPQGRQRRRQRQAAAAASSPSILYSLNLLNSAALLQAEGRATRWSVLVLSGRTCASSPVGSGGAAASVAAAAGGRAHERVTTSEYSVMTRPPAPGRTSRRRPLRRQRPADGPPTNAALRRREGFPKRGLAHFWERRKRRKEEEEDTGTDGRATRWATGGRTDRRHGDHPR